MSDDGPVGELVERIARRDAVQGRQVTAALGELGTSERALLESYVNYCAREGIDGEFLAEAYATIVDDTVREQIYFQRHGRYRYSRFAEVADSVYFNDDYMRRYMYGLALTAFFWPNHREIYRFFERSLPRDTGGRYLEIGPGHGLFLLRAMALAAYDLYLGIDISETSLAATRHLLSSGLFAVDRPWTLERVDFLEFDSAHGRFDAIVMGEVLEHVEEPRRFLERIRQLSHSGTFVFVTTAINAPAVDHIQLFTSVEQVETLAAEAGLDVEERLALPYPGLSLEETSRRRLPINVAFVLRSR